VDFFFHRLASATRATNAIGFRASPWADFPKTTPNGFPIQPGDPRQELDASAPLLLRQQTRKQTSSAFIQLHQHTVDGSMEFDYRTIAAGLTNRTSTNMDCLELWACHDQSPIHDWKRAGIVKTGKLFLNSDLDQTEPFDRLLQPVR
jgi:hypothetical protein